MWILLGLISSLFLGLYDVCKKHALNQNAVLPVLFFATLFSFLPMLVVLGGMHWAPDMMRQTCFYLPEATSGQHLHLLVKSLIIFVSWTLAYFAMKHLPISIVSPVRASGPVWTLIGALLIFHERPEPMQWAGMAVVFMSYFAFSLIGRKEGVHFHRSRWILYIFLATLVGTLSALYDKYLIQQLGYAPMLVQFWFAFYNLILFGGTVLLFWLPNRRRTTSFRWRWSIPLIGLLLTAADLIYFHAVRNPDALIVILSILRRSSVVVSFTIGSLLFGDVNRRVKAWALAGVLAGVILIVLS
jgi:transporter family protein